MRIGVLMGSFNPIHIGHQVMANIALNCGLFDKIVLVVSNNPWKASSSDMASFNDRLNMVKLAFKGINNIDISGIEQFLDNHYTYNVLLELQKIYIKDTLSLIIGLDNVSSFDKWKNPESIVSNFDVYYMKRDGVNQEKVLENIHEFRMKEIDYPDINTSSTYIRKLINDGLPCFGFVHKDVLEYIIKKDLYK